MLDSKFIRQNIDTLKKALESRKYSFDLQAFLSLDSDRRDLLQKIEELKSSQNKINAEMKVLLREKKDPAELIKESKRIKSEVQALESSYAEKDTDFKTQLDRIPNIPHESVPVGPPSENKLLNCSGVSFRSFLGFLTP